MPITAFSRYYEKELDFTQIIGRLASDAGMSQLDSPAPDEIPENWRQFIREDMECPCCFILGAELVRGARSRGSNKIIRQPYFRYSQHRSLCDFAHSRMEGTAVPENLVSFGVARSALTHAVRQLVGSGIEQRLLSQRAIRDMREWFFQVKSSSSFTVTLDPELPLWLAGIQSVSGWVVDSDSITLTKQVAALPGFDWLAAARREYASKHRDVIETMRGNRLWLSSRAKHLSKLVEQHFGEMVLDPKSLEMQYKLTIRLCRFIAENYDPVKRHCKRDERPPALLAFAALLLFLDDWDLAAAVSRFGQIAEDASTADETLGNVMGLNPWHDFEAWSDIRKMQDLGLTVPANAIEPQVEVSEIEALLRKRYQ